MIVAVYVKEINFLKSHLDKAFTIKDLGDLHFFLGIKVSYQEDGMVLTQHKFTKELFLASGVKKFKNVVTPLPLNTKLLANEGTLVEDPTLYRVLLRS